MKSLSVERMMPASPTESYACSSLRLRYQEIRRTSLELTQSYTAEEQMLQSMPDASPAKWHLAHTTWFFETFILSEHLPGFRPFDRRYKHLFNSYYKRLGSHPYRGARGLMARPTLHEVQAYRSSVDQEMERYLDTQEPKVDLIELGLNHEQQHQELILTDLKHALWSMPLRPESALTRRELKEPAQMKWIEVDGGIYSVGHSGDDFAFDNEEPRHEVLLAPFQIASRQVSNREFLEFMDDGGYKRPELWLSDGWDAVCAQGWSSPLYWEQSDGEWKEFAYSGMRQIDPQAPVCHVSYYEADAFARWSGARLPREQEWEIAARRGSPKTCGAFLEERREDPQPIGGAIEQWMGNVWEWTASPYIAYPGFVPSAGPTGEYNGKFMCNQFVLRGGSCATPHSHIRPSYRNFFAPAARWQFSGIRLAK
ncbi:MAG: ergothioneine biosynthesis protein EgtB [Acidobacteria bacterium]|nr:ergothioneine biosynthesis protein EgtB [Acidobacteriota bacterium]